MNDQPSETKSNEATPGRWRRILLNRWLLAGTGVVVMYALLGFFLTPWIVKRYISKYATEKLHRKASVEEVHVNPFLFTIEAKDFVLEEADNRPIMGFDRLFVDFELSSLFHWAWTFANISLERPSLYVEIQHNGRLNFADLADSFPKTKNPPPTDNQPPRLLVHHAAIVGGSFTFSDLSTTTQAQETFWPLNLEFNEISTIPEQKGPYTVKADLPGGGTVGWQGEISLQPISSEGKLSMAGFKLATAWKFVQDKLNIAEPTGEMNFSTHYRFDYQKSIPLLVLQDAKFALKGLLLTEKARSTPLLSLEAIESTGMKFDLQSRELMIPNIVVRDGKVEATVDEKGVLNWQKLVMHSESKDVTVPISGSSTPKSRPWRLTAGEVKVENIAVGYTDNSRGNPIALDVDGFNVLLNASAEIGAGPIKAMVDDLEVAMNRVSFSEAGDGTPLVSLDRLLLNDGHIDIGSRKIAITQVSTAGGGTNVMRGKDGKIQLVEILSPKDKGKIKRDIAKTAEKAKAEGKPWSFSLDTFEMNGFQVALQDNTITPAIVYDLKDIRASLKNLTNDGKTPIDFKTDFKVAQGGSVNVRGQVSQAGDRVDARTKITEINLKPLELAVAKFTTLSLESGNISVSARLKYRSAKSGPKLLTNGSVRVKKLMLSEEDTGERFLEWKEMAANGLEFGLSPDHIHIKEVKLLESGAKIVIFKDRSVNLAKILKRSDAVGEEITTQQEQAPAVEQSNDRKFFPVSIERVRVEKGVVDFADFSLVLPFATHVTDFNGGATGISSDPSSRTMVELEGKVDEYGFTKVAGGLSPFAPKTFTDLTVLFKNVKMEPLSPYSATFAGRKIASGTLNLKLEYKIQNSELLGDNQVVLDKFTLGERVEAPNAIHLPLDLAIALLTDAEGKIDVALPVKGNVDNPEFKYGRVIWKALVNLITKIVTAPFRALGGLFGGKGEQMDSVSFEPGSDRLLPPEMEKLKKVIEALEKRPQLKIVVQGRYDSQIDGKALRTERVKRALAELMEEKLPLNEEPRPVAFNTAKTQRTLEKLLEMRSGDQAIDDFKTRYEKETGRKVKRVKPYLAVFGWESSDTAFYQAIFEELVKLEPLLDNDLQDLAQRRAEAIVNEFKAAGGLDPSRVTAGSSAPVEKSSTDTVNTKLTLDVIRPAA
jgi:hypothetical protein